MAQIRFRLYRFATLEVSHPEHLDSDYIFECAQHTVKVRRCFKQAPNRALIQAMVHFDATRIVGMDDPGIALARRTAEELIVTYADIVAIRAGGRTELKSCPPLLAVTWPTGSEPDVPTNWAIGLVPTLPTILEPLVDVSLLSDAASDRASGISLLSQSLASPLAIARFTGFCRVFEDAFQQGMKILERKLWRFLGATDLDYTRQEIREWIENRDGACHADLKRARKHIMSIDVQHMVPRMQLAALDLLLNKAKWRSPTADRVERWRPGTALLNQPGEYRVTAGKPFNVRSIALDPFTGWPLDLDSSALMDGMYASPKIEPLLVGRMHTARATHPHDIICVDSFTIVARQPEN